MVRCGTGHLLGNNPLIKTHQPAAMGPSQGQQRGLGDLASTEAALPANQTVLEEAELPGQKTWLGWPQASVRRAATCWAGCGLG